MSEINLSANYVTSPSTTKLDEAMAKAQSEFGIVERDSKNPRFANKYASISAIWSTIRPVLGKYEITVSQYPIESESPTHLKLLTRLAHKGEFIMSYVSIPLVKNDVQGWGATLTYGKRYALTAIFGLADDDDDGETASGRGNHPSVQKSEPAKILPVKPASKDGKFDPITQIQNVIKHRSLNKELVGAWIRQRAPGIKLQDIDQKKADEIMATLVKATDESLELEISRSQNP